MQKIKENNTKVYKPEILKCPCCGEKLYYKFCVSNKVIQFSNGHYSRIKNLGYGCPNPNCVCSDITFQSQTANKLCFKGYTYSAKLLAMIAVKRYNGVSRNELCDELISQGIEISDRNVDIVYKHYEEILKIDYKENIKTLYDEMYNLYKRVMISIDTIVIDDVRVISIRDFFKSRQIGLHFVNNNDKDKIKKIIDAYLKDFRITDIFTIRPQFEFCKMLKERADKKVHFYYFEKI
jgi:hypothetical protein